MKHARNVAIIVVIALAVVALPGGTDVASLVGAIFSLLFAGLIAYFAGRYYRDHQVDIYGLGDTDRAILYASLGAIVVVLAASGRLTATTAGIAGRGRRARALRRRAAPASTGTGSAATEATSNRTSPAGAARCPTSPACTCSATATGRVIYVGKANSVRKRVASHFAKPGAQRRRTTSEMSPRSTSARRRHRGRGAADGAELHQAVPAALQHPPARRQVLSVHRDLARRGLPARLLHARAPPPRPRLLRAVLERQARARDARGARQGLPVPLLHRDRARPAFSGSPCLDYYIKRCEAPCVGYVSREEYRRGIDRRDRLPRRPLRRDRARTGGRG